MKMELLTLMTEKNKLDKLLEEHGGEMTPVVESIMTELDFKTEEGLSTAINLLKNLRSSIDTLESKKEKIESSLRSLTKSEDYIRGTIKTAMILSNTKRLETNTHSFLIKQIADKLEVHEESHIPESYFKEKIIKSLDKDLVKKDLALNFKIEGVSLKENFSLTIKEKL